MTFFKVGFVHYYGLISRILLAKKTNLKRATFVYMVKAGVAGGVRFAGAVYRQLFDLEFLIYPPSTWLMPDAFEHRYP